MSNSEINSAEFFGIEPGTPEALAFDNDTVHCAPDVTGVFPTEVEDYRPRAYVGKIEHVESDSLRGVSQGDQFRIKELIGHGIAPGLAIEAVLSDHIAQL